MKLFLPLAFLALFVSADAMGSQKRGVDWGDPIVGSNQGTKKTKHPRALQNFQIYIGNEENIVPPLKKTTSSPGRIETKKKNRRRALEVLPKKSALKKSKKRKNVRFSEEGPEVRTYQLPVEQKSGIQRSTTYRTQEDFQKALLEMNQPKKKKLKKPTKKINIPVEKKKELKTRHSQQKAQWLESSVEKVMSRNEHELTPGESEVFFEMVRTWLLAKGEEVPVQPIKRQGALVGDDLIRALGGSANYKESEMY